MGNKKPQFISVVAYVHNCSNKIGYFIDTINMCFSEFKQCEIIFVDDYSTDNSEEVIYNYFENHQTEHVVRIVRLGKYHGMEVAMNAGRDLSIGDYVYEFDDLYIDYEPGVVLEAYNKCLEGYDIVTVSTDVPIRFSSRLFYSIFNKAIDTEPEIGQESFRLLSRRAINRIISMGVNIPYRKVIYLNSGMTHTSVKYKSLTGIRPARITEGYERIDLAVDSFIYFTDITQRGAIAVSLFFAFLSCLAVAYAIWSRIKGYHVGLGYLSTMFFMSIGFTGLFAMIALVIRYLSVLVDLVFKKQRYLISEILEVSTK